MPTIAEILEARRAAKAAEPAPEPVEAPTPTLDLDDPDNVLIAAALDIFSAEIEKNPPEIATPFGPRVTEGVDHETS